MKILDAIRLAFRAPTVPGRSTEAERESARRIVSRIATGNVRLQFGRYSTREELDERRVKVKSYNFDA